MTQNNDINEYTLTVAPMDFNGKTNDSIKQAYWEERKKLDNKIADVEYQLACLKEIKKKSIESLKEKA